MKQHLCQIKNIIIRKNRLTTKMCLSVNRRGQVILSVPFFCLKKQIINFLTQHQEWIREQQKRVRNKPIFQNGQTISVLGQSVTIHHDATVKRGVFIDGTKLIVSGDIVFLNRRVRDFIKDQVHKYATKQSHILANKLNVSINTVRIKDTVSRWGSCSTNKNLNFCWRLGLAPLFVLDYIIAHEVAHLKEMNHGPRFWQTVSQLTDNRSKAEIWLRRHGNSNFFLSF